MTIRRPTRQLVTGEAALAEGDNATIVAHLTDTGEPALTVYANDVSTLAEGDARVAVRHTAATGPVDVLAGGSPIIEGLANPDEDAAGPARRRLHGDGQRGR